MGKILLRNCEAYIYITLRTCGKTWELLLKLTTMVACALDLFYEFY